MMSSRFRHTLQAAVVLFAGAVSALHAENYSITTFAGTTLTAGSADGTPGTFNSPYGVAIDSAKNLYVTDTVNNTIRKITPGRVVSTLAGTAGTLGSTDGTGTAARFNFPVGIAVDAAGNVYVADSKNFTIRKISAAGVVTTLAGAPFQLGAADGPGATARFFLPYGVAVDAAGNVFVADGGNHMIRKIAADGTVSTVAGTALQPSLVDGTGGSARFRTPWGLALDSAGNLYVADSENHAIRKVTPAGAVTTLAGAAGISGANDGPPSQARFNQPRGLSVDASGNVYVADYGNSVIRMVTPTGTVSTLAGSAGLVGAVDSVGSAARFYDTTDVVVDGSTIFVTDASNNLVRRGVPASQAALPVITWQPLEQTISAGQSVSFRVVASGSGLTYQWLKNGSAIAGATSATYTITSAQTSDTGAYVVRVGSPTGSVDSNQANLSVEALGTGPVVLTSRPLNQSVSSGQSVTFSVAATGSGLTYQWQKNGSAIAGATSASYTIPSAQVSDAGTYSVRVASGATSETATAKLIVDSSSGSGLAITTQPVGSLSVSAGQPATFTVAATSTGARTYQWFKDGVAISGATSFSYTIPSAQTGDAGSYTVRVTAGSESVTSSASVLTVTGSGAGPTARLANLSVRTTMPANQPLIVGTVVSGGTRNILVRAAGPALADFGLTTAMTNPRLELYNGSTSVFSNNDWPANLADTFAGVGAFAFAANSRDAAFVQPIDGARSIWAQGPTAGVVLVEAYDLGTGNSPRMINVSARNRVGTGDDILIAGFNIAGTGTKRLLFRAVGPRLGTEPFNISGVLADPKLEIYQGTTKLAENDSWDPALAPTFTAVGAFALDAGSRDAALMTTLAPGSYTVQVRGSDGGTGEAIVEIYEVP